MKFCTSCGDTINNTMNFCENCGIKLPPLQERAAFRPVNASQSIDEPQMQKMVSERQPVTVTSQRFEEQPQPVFTEQSSKSNAKKSAASVKQKKQILTGSVISIIGAIIATVILMPTPEKDLQKVYNYYNEGDQNNFMAAFNMPNETIGQAEDFYNEAVYYDWDTIYEELRAALENGETELYYMDPYYSNPIYEVTIESKLLFFKHAVFTYHPATIDIDFKEGQSILTIEESDIANPRDGMVKTSPIIPGVYSYSTILDGVAYEGSFEVVRENTNIFSLLVESDEEYSVKEVADDSLSDDERIYEDDVVSESDRAFITDLYETFRYEYAEALHYLEPERIEPMIGNGELYQDYKKFIVDHAEIAGYNYQFYENEITSIEPLGNGRFEVYAQESFDFTSDEEGTYYYERQKRYTIDSDERHYVIIDIETLHTDKQQY